MPSWKKLIISGSDAAIPSVSNTGDFTIDAGGDIILDADGTDIVLKDGGTSFGSFKRASSDFIIKSETQDKDILFKGNDGGSTITALTLDMSDAGSAIFNHDVKVNDSGKLKAGSGNDFTIHHDASNSYLINSTGHLYIQATEDDKDIVLQSDDGSGGVTAYLTIDGSSTRIKVDQNMEFQDDVALKFGTSDDMRIYHDGSNSYIRQEGTGNLLIRNDTADKDIILQSDDGSGGTTAYITLDGSATTVEIAKTTNVDGTLTATGDVVAFYSSDKRLKDNIVRIENPLEKIGKIGGYEFDWNDKQKTYEGHDVGVIAQEIQEVLPEVVTERDNGYLAVKYEKIVPLLIESIKELKQEVDDIKQKCDCLNK